MAVLENASAWRVFKLPRVAEFVSEVFRDVQIENIPESLWDIRQIAAEFFVTMTGVIRYRNCDIDCTTLEKLYKAVQSGVQPMYKRQENDKLIVDKQCVPLAPVSENVDGSEGNRLDGFTVG